MAPPQALSLALALCASPAGLRVPGDDPEAVRRVAETYLERAMAPDLEGELELVSDDFFFVDGPGEIFGSGLERGLTGRARYAAVAASWGIEEIELEVQARHVWGGHAVFAGRADWRTSGGFVARGLPFATILTVCGDRIAGRRDFGQYADLLGGDPVRRDELVQATDAYLEAYAARDFGALEELVADDARFFDESARWEGSWDAAEGRLAFLERLERADRTIRDVRFEWELRLHSGRHAFLLGTQHCLRAQGGARVPLAIPVLHLVAFREGELVEHLVYADQAAVRAQLAANERGNAVSVPRRTVGVRGAEEPGATRPCGRSRPLFR